MADDGGDAHEYTYTFTDTHRLKSLLLRKSRDRQNFWSHLFQNPELSLICCGDEDIRVHVKIWGENLQDLRTELVSNDKDFHRILLYEDRARSVSLV